MLLGSYTRDASRAQLESPKRKPDGPALSTRSFRGNVC